MKKNIIYLLLLFSLPLYPHEIFAQNLEGFFLRSGIIFIGSALACNAVYDPTIKNLLVGEIGLVAALATACCTTNQNAVDKIVGKNAKLEEDYYSLDYKPKIRCGIIGDLVAFFKAKKKPD